MEVRWLPFAQKQLKVVVQYVVDNFGEMTAKKSLQTILSKVEALSTCPDRGVWDKKFSTSEIRVRHLNIGPNVVYYLIDRDEVVVIGYALQTISYDYKQDDTIRFGQLCVKRVRCLYFLLL